MRLYYDDVTGDAKWTYDGTAEDAPSGVYIEIAGDVPTLNGLKVIAGVPTYVDLSPLRQLAINRINSRIGAIRSTFVTDIVGQPLIYGAKEDEARAYVHDPDPDMANYPMTAAEVGPDLTAPDAWSLAQLWLNMATLWRQIAAPLETARLRAVYAIEAATSEAQIAAIEAAFEEALQ